METVLRKSGTVLAALAVMLLMVACQSTTGRTLGENIDDTGTTAAVKAKLAGERISTLTRIDIDTNQGVVALNGTVQTEAMKARAEQIARQVKGVRDVINSLRIQAAARLHPASRLPGGRARSRSSGAVRPAPAG
jgi:hyperosmotically inducible periplasmic protein